MKSLRTANVQFFFAVAVGMLMVSHWTRDLPWFPAIVLGVGGITIAHAVIREGTRWLRRLRSEERRDPLTSRNRR